MEDQDDELHLKQSFLKTEIIDKNIDQDKFLDYCMQIKENGDDINSWTFDELKKCVSDFDELLKKESEQEKEKEKEKEKVKEFASLNSFLSNNNTISNLIFQSSTQQQTQIQTQTQSQNQFNLKNISNIISNSLFNNNNQNSQLQSKNKTAITLNPLQLLMNSEKLRQKIDSDIQEESLQHPNLDNVTNLQKREIKCKLAEKTKLNDKKIKVIIQNPKNSEKSLLSTQYTLYEVCTQPLNWLVQRRYSDFDWLRNILCKLFPRLFIPPIPGKKTGQRRFEQDFIDKRMKFLQMFMDEIMENEELKANEALISFLSFTDRTQFERKMKELNSYIPSHYCEDLKTLEGKIYILNDDFNENYYININNYLKLRYQILSRLNNNLKSFFINQTKACMDLDEVQKDFETLNILSTKVKLSNKINKTYEELNIFFKNWKRILFNENMIIKEQIKHFFKREKIENLIFIELIDSREQLRQKYFSEKTRLDAKKEKLYKINDFNKWEIEDNFGQIDTAKLMRDKSYALEKMCTRETHALENMHKQLGYANYMNIVQLKNKIENNEKKLVAITKEFANKFYPSLNDGITLWSTLNTYI